MPDVVKPRKGFRLDRGYTIDAQINDLGLLEAAEGEVGQPRQPVISDIEETNLVEKDIIINKELIRLALTDSQKCYKPRLHKSHIYQK